MKKLFLLFVALLLSTSTLVGQNDPIAIHPFETRLGAITADTLNIHLSVPVIKKTGIGLPFSYDLVFNNNFWTPNGSQWSPGGEIAFGWSQMGAFRSGVLTGSRGELCADNVHHDKIYNQFVDPRGIAHPIPGAPITVTCGPPQTVLLTDGSGVTVTLASDTQGITVATYPDGTVVTPYTSIKDVNGNAISVTSNGTFPFTVTDTLNVPELTISDVHSLYGNSQFTYTYPAPNSTTASVVQNLSLYTVQTNFGCAAHTDYGPFPNFYLLNNIVLPDGSQYSFTYEQTPGGAAGNVTRRLASLTLPTGGIIRYTYTGPNNAINCTDGTTAGLTATTSDGPTTYVRDTTNWNQTTVTQASGDYAIYNFAAKNPGLGPFYEVQRRFYASDGTLKLTETACYNGNQTNCGSVTTAPSLQINQIDKYTLIAGKSAQSRSTTLFDAYNNVTDTKAYDFVCTTAATPVCTAPRSETVITYGSYSSGNCVAVGNGIVNKPCKIQNKNGSNTVAETHMTYNATGHPTATAQLVSGTTYLTINATYNANGTVATVTDPNNALTTIHYDGTGGCNNGLATSTGYPLNLADSMTWDCNGGVPLVYTDVNSNTLSVLSYD